MSASDNSPVKAAFAAIVSAFAKDRQVTLGRKARAGFGASALCVEGKIFAMVSSKGVFVVKLPATRVQELISSGKGAAFTAGKGRPMKEWVELKDTTSGDWLALAKEAKVFVRGLE